MQDNNNKEQDIYSIPYLHNQNLFLSWPLTQEQLDLCCTLWLNKKKTTFDKLNTGSIQFLLQILTASINDIQQIHHKYKLIR